MTPYAIEDTTGRTLDVVKADNDLDALNVFAASKGYGGRYIENVARPSVPGEGRLADDEHRAYRLQDGALCGAFENLEIVARPIGDEYVDVDYLKGLSDLDLAAVIVGGDGNGPDIQPVADVAEAIAEIRGYEAAAEATAGDEIVLPLTQWQAQRIHDLLTTLADVQKGVYDVAELQVDAEVDELCALIRAHGGAGGESCARCGTKPATTRQTYRDWDATDPRYSHWTPHVTIRCDRCAQDLREYCDLPRIGTVILEDRSLTEKAPA